MHPSTLYRAAGIAFAPVLLVIAPFAAESGPAITEKPYDVQSGIVERTRTVKSGPMIQKTVETLYFKEWGRVRATIGTETTSVGKRPAQSTRKHSLMEGTTLTVIDLEARTATRVKSPLSEGFGSMTSDQATAMAKKMGKAMNIETKPAGTAVVAGKSCEVTESTTTTGALKQTTRLYTWKRILLKSESKTAATEIIEEATSVTTDVPIPADKFMIPAGVKVTTARMP